MPVSSSSGPAPTATTRSSGWRLALMAALVLGLLMLCAGALVVVRAAQEEAATVSAQAERTPQGAKIALRGEGWPARIALTISGSAPPGGQAPLDLGTAQSNADGEFRASKLARCTTSDSTTAGGRVTITVSTGDGSVRAESWVPAGVFVCPPR